MARRRNLNVQIEDSGEKFDPNVLMSEPVYRMVLLRYARRVTHSGTWIIRMATMQAIRGHVILFADPSPMKSSVLRASCRIESKQSRVQLRLTIDDSALLVSNGSSDFSMTHSEELDVWQVPRPERRPRGGGLPSSVSSHMFGSYTDPPFSATAAPG